MFGAKFRLSDDEDDFFGDVESSRKNLSSIFGVSLDNPQQNTDHSLKYVAPKQTKPASDAQTSEKAPSWNIQIAKVVTAFKLENQENVSQGKIGLAVLKSPENQFKIILYRSKHKVLSTFTIKEDSKVFLKNSYLQFSDDLNIFWSVLFESVENNEVLDLLKGKVIIEETKENDSQIESPEVTVENKETKVECNSSDEKVSDTKAQILSRMAKMGQPLPKIAPATTTDFSDSSDTECRGRLPPKPVVVPRKQKSQQLIAVTPSNSTTIAPIVTNLAGFSQNFSQDSQYINMLLCENRTQNSEIRMNMSKLETKIEKVLDKIDTLGTRESRMSGKCKEDEILDLEEKMLELKKANRSLKVKIDELEALSSRTPTEELLKQEDVDEFNHYIELFNIQTNQFTNLNEFYKTLLRHLTMHCESLKCEKETFEKSLENLKNNIDSLKKQKEQEVASLSEELLSRKEKLNESEKLIEKLIAENKELSRQKELCREDAEKMVDTMLKDIMNNLYRSLVTKFDENKNFSSMEILRICGSAIKDETNNAIKKKNCED